MLLTAIAFGLRQATDMLESRPVSATVALQEPSSTSRPAVLRALDPAMTIVSRDGVALSVRPMRRSDGPALTAAVAGLSGRSRYRRFMAPKPSLSRREVAILTDVDHHAREALVAVDPHTGAWVAVARYATFPDDPRTADVAVTVADAWQGRGVGRALLELIVDRAAQEGIAALRATTLAENRPAIRLLHRLGFATTGLEHDALELARAV
jgi:RimJ/RimL family protein N-acetyltransferase